MKVEVEDIGEVVDEVMDEVMEEGQGRFEGGEGEIVHVLSCEEYSSCCKAKVVKVTDVIGECTKCGGKMKIRKCVKSIAARVVIEDNNGDNF